MQVDSKKTEDNKVQIDISLTKLEADERINEVAIGMQPNARIKGFRKGKAPLGVIRSHYHKEIMAEATTRMIYHSTSEALKDRDLRNASNPILLEEFRPKPGKQYVGSFHLDGSFSFSINIEPPPDVDVTDYKGLSVELGSGNYEGWFKHQIKEQQVFYGEKTLVERAVQKGDEITADFISHLPDGSVLETEEEYKLLVGEETGLHPDFQNSFIGHSGGESFSTQVQYPEVYALAAEFSGKLIRFECKVREVYELSPHELNEDLAMLLSYDSVDALMESYKETWDQQYAQPMRAQIFSAIADVLLNKHEFTAPQAWIDNELSNTVKRLGIENVESDEETLRSLSSIAERTVKTAYLLDKIYEKELDIHLGVEEFKQIASDEAVKQNIESGAHLIETIKNNGQYEGYVTYHEQQKTIDFLVSETTVIDKE